MNYNKIKRSRRWRRLIGPSSIFSLEARIFHSVSIITLLALAYNIPFNIIIGLPLVATLSFITSIIFAILYYYSRVKGKTEVSILIGGIIGYILFTLNYFFNSGINGPTFLFFALALTLMLAISPSKQRVWWLAVNLIIALGLHLVEYLYPDKIENTYSSTFNRFADSASAYMVVGVLIYFSLKYIKDQYTFERKSSEYKALAIDAKNQQILRQNRQLEYLNTEKDKLFSIIAHDLRSPLLSIQSYLELLSDYSLDDEDKERLHESLLSTTKNTTNMLSNLLSWSRTQMEGVICNPKCYNIYALLHPSLAVEHDLATKKGVELTIAIDMSLEVMADADMLQLVIRNLVNNAIKFTSKGGNILIEAKGLNDQCQILVKDTGTGIPFIRQKDIFSLKAQSTYGTENEKGIGLGLLLCKEFTELQGGKLWFESKPGSGTAFYLLIPLASEAGIATKERLNR